MEVWKPRQEPTNRSVTLVRSVDMLSLHALLDVSVRDAVAALVAVPIADRIALVLHAKLVAKHAELNDVAQPAKRPRSAVSDASLWIEGIPLLSLSRAHRSSKQR